MKKSIFYHMRLEGNLLFEKNQSMKSDYFKTLIFLTYFQHQAFF